MGKIKVLLKKEILDMLRDKKTLAVMVLVPVLLYPLIIIGMSLAFSVILQSQEEQVHTVVCAGQEEPFAELLQLYEERQEELEVPLEFVTEERDGAVLLESAVQEGGGEHFLIRYDSADGAAKAAADALQELLELYRQELLIEDLEQAGLEESFLYPVTYEVYDSASLTESFGMDIGGSIGMMLIVTILLGAVYPAIDATAGEKERGTLETLLTLPVTNFQMLMSKYLAVALFACVTAILSLLSLGGSVLFLIFGISEGMSAELEGMSAASILPVIPMLLLAMVVTALLASALCMCFCVFARSFKEANNYVTPVLLVVMFASMAGMLPAVRLNYATALIPIVNVSLMIKQALSWQMDFALAGIVLGVNLAYSVLTVWLLSRIYSSENVLFSDGTGGVRLIGRRSEIPEGTMPGLGDVVLTMTVVLLLVIYVGTAAAARLGFWGTVVSQLLILAAPLAAAWYLKSDFRALFFLRRPRGGALAGGVLLYLGTYCLMMAMSSILTGLFPGSAENLNEGFQTLLEQPFPLLVLVLAVMPAVGEELLFRGFLAGTLMRRTGRVKGIVISALIFGAFHMSLIKLLPTALLGGVFAYLMAESGSLYVTSILHACNNLLSVLVMKYPQEAARLVPLLARERLSAADTALLVAAGAVCGAAGLWLLRRHARDAGKQKRTNSCTDTERRHSL